VPESLKAATASENGCSRNATKVIGQRVSLKPVSTAAPILINKLNACISSSKLLKYQHSAPANWQNLNARNFKAIEDISSASTTINKW
jgi:hypothetical protein